jgi:vancomycin permeability regulator SanA
MILLFRLFRRLFTFLLLLAIVIPGYFMYSIWSEGHNAKPVKSDAIVISRSRSIQRSSLPDILQARIDKAAEVFHQGLAQKIITVGGNAKGDNYTEAGAESSSLFCKIGLLRACSHRFQLAEIHRAALSHT